MAAGLKARLKERIPWILFPISCFLFFVEILCGVCRPLTQDFGFSFCSMKLKASRLQRRLKYLQKFKCDVIEEDMEIQQQPSGEMKTQRWWFGTSFGTQISGGLSRTWKKTWAWSRTFTDFCLWLLDNLEKEMATHTRILACRISWIDEPGKPQYMGSQRVRHD